MIYCIYAGNPVFGRFNNFERFTILKAALRRDRVPLNLNTKKLVPVLCD